MTSNLYVLVVANKGAGKTPSSRAFLKPLANLEKDEMAKFDDKIKKKKKGPAEKEGEGEEGLDGADEAAEKEPKKKKKKMDKEDDYHFRFHPKTRVVEQITPEALIMALKSGDGVLVIVSDEFKVKIIDFDHLFI